MTKASELAHLFRQLKAPAAARALPKLAQRAREESSSYERFCEALLSTEVASRESHGGESRINGATAPPARGTSYDRAALAALQREEVKVANADMACEKAPHHARGAGGPSAVRGDLPHAEPAAPVSSTAGGTVTVALAPRLRQTRHEKGGFDVRRTAEAVGPP
jgi:hypothetical protein